MGHDGQMGEKPFSSDEAPQPSAPSISTARSNTGGMAAEDTAPRGMADAESQEAGGAGVTVRDKSFGGTERRPKVDEESLEPVGPDEVCVLVQTGENVELSPKLVAALERLADAMNEEAELATEVAGFAYPPTALQMGEAVASGVGAMGIGFPNICICKGGLHIGTTAKSCTIYVGPTGPAGGAST